MTPSHYITASQEGRIFLSSFLENSIHDGIYEQDLFSAAKNDLPWLLKDALLFNAFKYLWRLGAKGDASEDIRKAIHYLDEWMSIDSNDFHQHSVTVYDLRVALSQRDAGEGQTAYYAKMQPFAEEDLVLVNLQERH